MEPPTVEEVELLQELRERLVDLQMSEEDLTDKNLARFLRARNGNLDAAELMIRNNQQWQETEDVKTLLAEYECPTGWEEDFYYALTGFDRGGNPIIVSTFGKWDIQKETSQGNKEEFIRFICHHMERGWTLVKRCSEKADHMKQAVCIVDLAGFSLRQVASVDVVEAAIRCVKTFEANYPETVKTVVLVNAPWPFQILWKLVRPFLSERTQGKLFFLGSYKEKWREAISKFADTDQFPELFGGDLPDTFKIHICRDGSTSTSENQNIFEAGEELPRKSVHFGV